MKAFRIHGVKDARIEDVPDPRPAEGWALIEPIVSGLCATDVHIYFEGALIREYPLTMGHEVVGRVTELRGDPPAPYGRDAVKVGDVVCCEPMIPCGKCYQCVRGNVQICLNITHIGIWDVDGNWAEAFTIPAGRAIPLHPSLDPKTAVLTEPLACALNFCERAGVGPGKTIVVLGAGPAGLLTIQTAAAAGSHVIVSEPSPKRREVALSLGASVAVQPEQAYDAIMEATQGVGADAIIEVTGVPAAVAQSIELSRPGGTVVFAGVCGSKTNPIDTNAIVTKELTINGGLASRWHFGRAMQLISSGAIDIDSLVSVRAPWTQVGDLLDTAAHDRDVVKILLDH